MQWYYSKNHERQGPISQEELDALFQAGRLSPETLVWREGMLNWTEYRLAMGLDQEGTYCAECRQPFSKDNLVKFDQTYVCGGCKMVYLQRLREGVAGFGGIWRYKKLIILKRDAVFPDRCVKCNEPANGFKLKRSLMWHSPILYVLLCSILVYALVALLVSRRAVVHVGLCEVHRAKRKRNIFISWGIMSASIICFVLSAVYGVMVGVIGLILLVAAAIYSSATVLMVSPRFIDKMEVKLSGAGKAFLDSLPEKPF